MTAEAIAASAGLRVIGRAGVGFENIDVEAATRHRIVVMNAPAGPRISTAELTFALLLSLARHVPEADAFLKAEKWDRKRFAGMELAGKRLGIVGLGRIGRAVAARAQAFGMDVWADDPYLPASVAESLRVPLVSLDALLAGSDFVTLHAPLTDETRGLIGAEALAKAKPGMRIVNAARGGIVDEEALLRALESGRVAGAALDVHAEEPPRDWRLVKHPRVVATPHIGAGTAESQERMAADVAQQVRDFLADGTARNVVNPEALGGRGPAVSTTARMTVGLDLGGTKLLMVAGDGEERRVERVATGPAFGPEALEAEVRRFVRALPRAPEAVGLAVPGLVGADGRVQACDVLPRVVGWRPAAALSGPWDFHVLNDAEAALVEEAQDAPPEATIAVVMAGTGIGAAFLLHGRVFGGANGWAGELGSVPLATADGVRTLDQLASGEALVRRLGAGDALVARLDAGDAAARTAVEEAGAALGLALAMVVDLFNPSAIAIGGGVALLPGYLEAALRSAARHALPDPWGACVVRKVRAGDLVAALGAARAAATRRAAT